MQQNAEKINMMDRLKLQTKELHVKAHELPFFRALFRKELKIDSYIGQLKAFAVIAESLERNLAECGHPAVKAVLNGYMPKLPLIAQDIAFFAHLHVRESAGAMEAALSAADKIARRKEQNPLSLLGHLYTLEGSTLGGKIILRHMAEQFGLKIPEGLRYFDSYSEHVQSNWQNFSSRMLNAVTEENTEKDIIEASCEFFSDLLKVYDALHPLEGDRT